MHEGGVVLVTEIVILIITRTLCLDKKILQS